MSSQSAVLLACLLLSPAQIVPESNADAPEMSLDAIVARIVESRGGLKLTSWRGHAVYESDEASIPYVVEVVRPDRQHFRMQTGYRHVINGTTGWMLSPDESPRPQKMSPAQAEREGRNVFFTTALSKAHREGTLKLLGKQSFDGRPVYVLKLIFANGDVGTYYYDAETFLLAKMTEVWNIDGDRVEFSRTLSDYRLVEGLPFAFNVVQETVTGWRRWRLVKVEVNPEIDMSVFAPPPSIE